MKTVTTFEDAKNIISDMRNAGASNIRYSLLGWQNNGYYGNIMRKYGIEGSTGGKSGLKKLNAWAEENGVELSLDQNMLLIYGSPKGASLRDAVVKNAGTEYLRYKLVNNAGVFMSGSNCYYMSPLYYHNKMLSKDIKLSLIHI